MLQKSTGAGKHARLEHVIPKNGDETGAMDRCRKRAAAAPAARHEGRVGGWRCGNQLS